MLISTLQPSLKDFKITLKKRPHRDKNQHPKCWVRNKSESGNVNSEKCCSQKNAISKMSTHMKHICRNGVLSNSVTENNSFKVKTVVVKGNISLFKVRAESRENQIKCFNLLFSVISTKILLDFVLKISTIT